MTRSSGIRLVGVVVEIDATVSPALSVMEVGLLLSFTLCQQTKGEHSHIDPSFCPTHFLSKEVFPDGVAG